MTVCIGALFENGNGAVLACDHMITAHIPIAYEFEDTRTSKIDQLTDDVYVMYSGSILHGDRVINLSKSAIQDLEDRYVGEVAAVVGETYRDYRLSALVSQVLTPRGLTLARYYEIQPNLNAHIVGTIDDTLANGGIGLELIIVGPSTKGYGIYVVGNPGISMPVNALGYTATGSGSPHAQSSLLEDKYHKSLDRDEVVGMIKNAMARSAAAPGVGRDNSILILPEEDNNASIATE